MEKLFENIMQENQPECDMIFAYKEDNPTSEEKSTIHDLIDDKNHKYYDVPETVPEEEATSNTEYETIKMLREIGIGPSLDEPLSSKHTLPSVSYYVPSKSSSIPVLIDSKYFELKQRKPSTSPKGENSNNPVENEQKVPTEEKPKQTEKRRIPKLAINFNVEGENLINLEENSSPSKPLNRKSNYSTPKEVYMKKRGCKTEK